MNCLSVSSVKMPLTMAWTWGEALALTPARNFSKPSIFSAFPLASVNSLTCEPTTLRSAEAIELVASLAASEAESKLMDGRPAISLEIFRLRNFNSISTPPSGRCLRTDSENFCRISVCRTVGFELPGAEKPISWLIVICSRYCLPGSHLSFNSCGLEQPASSRQPRTALKAGELAIVFMIGYGFNWSDAVIGRCELPETESRGITSF